MDYYNQMNDIMGNPEIWQEANEDFLNIAELYNLYYGIMSFSIEPKEEDKNFKIKALYSSIFVTIANSITAVIYLAENGLDYQANVINRQLFEICMLLLNVMIDENKEKILTDTEMTEGNMKIWRKYFSPKELNDTIENYEKRIPIARENFEKSGFADRITLIPGDAAEVLKTLDGPYDFIFMDAAKGQYIHFLPEVLRVLDKNGVLITDNVLQDGDVIESRFAVERRNRTIHKRMREYLFELTHNEGLLTSVVPLGDGIAITMKSHEKREETT